MIWDILSSPARKSILLLSLICLTMQGCAATQVALEKKDLKVETQMSDTVFLDITNRYDKTVFLDIRNTSDKDIDVTPYIAERLKDKNYTVVTDPGDAYYIIQANVLYVGMADPSALRQSVFQGWGGVAGGAAAGAAISEMAESRTLEGASLGGIVGGFAEILTGSITKDVTYTIMTDVQILERSPYPVTQTRQAQLKQGKDVSILQSSSHVTDRYIYQTRIASSANQVNLDLEDALPPLMEGIGRSIAGIF
ncbi:MAG: complement resistance protein TraT [Desulfovibrionaceae bacterium]|nr:complement resistance protein TraT [Desulfovibrionaceae bacterium]